MCCVGGMVEETTCEVIGHWFEPHGVRIYSDAFFSKCYSIWYLAPQLVLNKSLFSTGRPVPAVAAGTKGLAARYICRFF